jgi:carbamoylphosphate synthase small subunit
MKIDIKSKDSVYITINNHTYYIDDSTNEQIIEKWNNDNDNDFLEDLFNKIDAERFYNKIKNK